MGTKSFETTVELEGNEVEVTVEYSYSPGTPGKFYGPPENCYPDEPAECEVEVIYLTADKAKTDIMPKLSTETIEQVFEQACGTGEESMNDDYERAMEDKADAAREREWDR
jgi:hypothetical protein